MNHQVRWDDKNACVRFRLVGEIEPHEAAQALTEVISIFEGKPARWLLVDHRDSQRAISTETRAVLKQYAPQVNPDKIAFIGMSNLNRIVAKIIVAIIGKSGHTKFFITEDEALAWFQL